uniref:CSON002253 protein n=1 Tax=Culicoides sonorensis TaxID=179676 RepID=A0A336M3W7_CULSO
MEKKFVVIFVVFASIFSAYGDQLTILRTPKALDFKGSSALSTESIQQVYATSLGYSIVTSPDTSGWEGLTVNDPFNTASGFVSIIVEGLSDIEFKNLKSYSIYGSGDPVSSALDDVHKHEGTSVDLDLKTDVGKTLETVYGVLVPQFTRKVNFLKPKDNKADQDFLNQIAMIDGLSQMLKENYDHVPTATVIRISLENVLNLHQVTTPAYDETLKILKSSIEDLVVSTEKAYKNKALITLITSVQSIHKRVRRAVTTDDDRKYNIAPTYDENYPVIFNIVFWFSVVMIFTLLAISLAIGNMDPGRDSIIYRMTSTRIKKDN